MMRRLAAWWAAFLERHAPLDRNDEWSDLDRMDAHGGGELGYRRAAYLLDLND